MHVRLDAALALSDITGISSVAFADLLSDGGIDSLDPRFEYWSPNWSAPGGASANFEDGGSLENTGVASLLAYGDIDAVVAFVNTSEALQINDGKIVIAEQVPALFGLRKYDSDGGYRPYTQAGVGNPDFADNKVFSTEAGEFEALLEGLHAAAASGGAAAFRQRLTTVANPKFAVPGGKAIDVLWVYLNEASSWTQLLEGRARRKLPDEFPHYGTLSTELSAAEVNYLAHFTSWSVGQLRTPLRAMFSMSEMSDPLGQQG